MIRSPAPLNYRQKALIGLLSAFGGRLANRDFQKYLFLYAKEFEKEPSFDFVPYKYGCFSFQSYADKRRLIEVGVLSESEDWRLKSDPTTGDLFDAVSFDRCYRRYGALKGETLVREVYRRYPYFAINSEIAERLMNQEEMDAIEAARPSGEGQVFFTIGYEGSSFDDYLNRLIRNNIRLLVDVRRNPLSRKYGFSKKTLSETITKLGLAYVHLPELGIASEKRQKLETQADYDRLFDDYERGELQRNKSALQHLFDLFDTHKRVAITCFEADVCQCHRGRIVKALKSWPQWRFEVRHI